jgi:hypothetical protein
MNTEFYEKLIKADLENKLFVRKLNSIGTKRTLINRLIEDDEKKFK